MKRLSVLFFLGIIAAAVRAQTGAGFDTIESLAAPSETAFVGTISSAKSLGNKPVWPVYELTIDVEDVLRGTPGKEHKMEVVVHNDKGQWQKTEQGKTRFIWFLYPGGQYKAVRLATDEDRRHYGSEPLPLLSMDLTVVKTPEEAIARARIFLRDNPLTVHSTGLDASSRLIFLKLGSLGGDWNGISLPVVPEIEKIAKRIIADPQPFFPEYQYPPHTDIVSMPLYRQIEMDMLRVAAVNLLKHFKTDENQALLRKLLHDPTVAGFTEHLPQGEMRLRRHYPVRKAALEVLTHWGEQVTQPIIVLPLSDGGHPSR